MHINTLEPLYIDISRYSFSFTIVFLFNGIKKLNFIYLYFGDTYILPDSPNIPHQLYSLIVHILKKNLIQLLYTNKLYIPLSTLIFLMSLK